MAMAPATLLVAVSLALLVRETSSAAEAGNLALRASGFPHARGYAVAKLFAHGDNVTGRGRWQASATIVRGIATFEFGRLPAGDYAIVIYQDENDNGAIDHNAFGLPSEPLGFSNGFRLGLISGPPTFEKLRFRHGADPQLIEITVR